MQVRKIRMQSHLLAKDDYGDVFHSHYAFFVDKEQRTDPLREFVMESFPRWLTYSRKEKLARKKEYGEGKRPNEVSPLVDKFVRFSVAITGGLFLVVPMLIMTLGGQSQNKSLITVSVAVFWFVLSLAFGIRVSNAETLVATATYAAVLVVFVGTSSSGSNS
jgi:VIT1/CCC1 family predicted Fe2+/Mn2+ transporter